MKSWQGGKQQLAAPCTTLTAFFELCRHDEFAQQLLYADIPKYYTWGKDKSFKRWKMGEEVEGHPSIVSSATLGRVYTVHPNNCECYYLQQLLHHVKGPTSFDPLNTVEGVVCGKNQAACIQLGLLRGDEHSKPSKKQL